MMGTLSLARLAAAQTEPILQWTLGDPILPSVFSAFNDSIVGLKISSSPCNHDVALLALTFAPNTQTGVYVGVTRSAFKSPGTVWFNTTMALCSALSTDCTSILMVDIMLTTQHVLILTSLGLFISKSLVSGHGSLMFSKVDSLGQQQVDYLQARLWYSSSCFLKKLATTGDYISMELDTHVNQRVSCLYSRQPFTQWYLCPPPAGQLWYPGGHGLFLHDWQMDAGVVLSQHQDNAQVSVFRMEGSKLKRNTIFPAFLFDFRPRGMMFHTNTYNLYVYGTQVWLSNDGGNSFTQILALSNEIITSAATCNEHQEVLFISNLNKLYLSRAGVARCAQLQKTIVGGSAVHCGQNGGASVISFDPNTPGGLKVESIDTVSQLMSDSTGCNHDIALQYLSRKKVMLLEAFPLLDDAPKVPCFLIKLHIGKHIILKSGGEGVITQVFPGQAAEGFLAKALVDMLVDFQDVKVVSVVLNVANRAQSDPTVQLTVGGSYDFTQVNTGAIIVIPGDSSFLIRRVDDSTSATALATSPTLVPPQSVYAVEWLLFNVPDKAWEVKEGRCKHTLQVPDILIKDGIYYLAFLERQIFRFSASEAASTFYQKRLLSVTLGNPFSFQVHVNHFWYSSGTHLVNISIFSLFYNTTWATVTVHMPGASLRCSVTSFTFALLNSCPPEHYMTYIPEVVFSEYELLYGEPLDEMDRKMLMNLPVNYKPPSDSPDPVSLSSNIYNADPSKPFEISNYPIVQKTSHFKQCEFKSTRQECNCTSELKLSPLVIHSDCRERVLRLPYHIRKVKVTLILQRPDYEDHPLSPVCFIKITELNNRAAWDVFAPQLHPALERLRLYLTRNLNEELYHPEGLKIGVNAYELYHFRISLFHGCMPCDLEQEIQVFHHNPLRTSIAQWMLSLSGTTFVCLIIPFAVLYKIHGFSFVKKTIRNLKKRQTRVHPYTGPKGKGNSRSESVRLPVLA
ncbi:cation channel sperm-associated protein subunit beta-like [Polypterus senegalus]|uniref:cation channel sperm-associated protein subunit beta-like n=1 Tax=Polypterus senegalus TaxID=55291 RepID=UPI00196689F9|nr:cation channel sperm-associated protein subunit beta-like [Polypterus senegalus]